MKSYISLHGGAAIRTDDFVTSKILGCIDKQILLPTALRCALRSRERRELRVKISELCVLFATLCALKHADQIKSVE